MKATIRDISKITGFSSATVSNAMNRKKGVNPETAEHIMRVAKELGYSAETMSKKMHFVMYKTNGLITDGTPFFSMMIDGFQKACKRLGFEMVMHYLDIRDEDFKEQTRELTEDASAAVVLMGAEMMDEDFQIFLDSKCLLLTLDYWSDEMRCNGILINNDDAVMGAVDYLAEKGHKDVGYLKGNFRIKAFRERENGYHKGLLKNTLEYNPQYTVELTTTMDGAYADMKQYLANKPKLPTAFFADNDMIALGAMKALREAGILIPDQISIVGFDDLPFSEISTPRLSSLRVPKQDMGAMAVYRMMEMMHSQTRARTKILVCPEFVERDSVKDISMEQDNK